MRTYYDVLGVTPGSPNTAIRAAYRALMSQHHPDKSTTDRAAAEAKAKLINEAFAVLSNPATRARYDASMAAKQPTSPAHSTVEARAPVEQVRNPPALREAHVEPVPVHFSKPWAVAAVVGAFLLIGQVTFLPSGLSEAPIEEESGVDSGSLLPADGEDPTTIDASTGVEADVPTAPTASVEETTSDASEADASSAIEPGDGVGSLTPDAGEALSGSAGAAAQRPELGGLDAEEGRMVEAACSYEKSVKGPAEYYACLREQLAALQGSSGRPNLTRMSSSERAMAEAACSYERSIKGPAPYYQCLTAQASAMRAVTKPPSLNGLNTEEIRMVESACSYEKSIKGPASYYSCLRRQLTALKGQ